MSSHPQYSYSLPPPMQDGVRLPSIKDLNFPPPGQDGAPTNGSGRAEHSRSRHDNRHEPSSWRAAPPPSAAPPQHSAAMPPPHDPPPKSHLYAPQHKPDASYHQGPPPQQPPSGGQHHNGVGAGPPRPENSADASSKRSRSSQSGVSASPARSPHVSLGSPVKARLHMIALTYCDSHRLSISCFRSIWSL
ncbi:hypothetical protein C8Q74DRAFT_614650 [Fomes fomentarius]|nr:hypothetical protein C8Q74DRAFT_614650 [Fomes fomentarius]